MKHLNECSVKDSSAIRSLFLDAVPQTINRSNQTELNTVINAFFFYIFFLIMILLTYSNIFSVASKFRARR